MPSSLFGTTATPTMATVQNPGTFNSGTTGIVNPSPDTLASVEQLLSQSGGDPKAAFYSLAQAKGIDPNQFLNQISSMGNPKSLLMNMVASNPTVGRLLSLFGGKR